MNAILLEPKTKIKKRISRRPLRCKELIPPRSWGLNEYQNKQTPTRDESIHSQPLLKHYFLNAEPASFNVAAAEASITHRLLQTMVVDESSKIDHESLFEQPAKKISLWFSLLRGLQQQKAGTTQEGSISPGHIRTYLARAMASEKPVSISSKIESIMKDHSDSVRRLSERIIAENHKKLNEIVKSFVTASALKAHEIQAMVLQNDDGNQFSSLLDDLKAGIESPSSDAVDAVLEIQCLPIPEALKNETLLNLVEFIKKHRATNTQKVLIAVGSAIRKVLLNIADEQLFLAAELMTSTGSLEVPIEVELEVAKMVVHRFRYAPNTSTAGLSDLAWLLLENAKLYSSAKLANRKYYGATALNSVLAIVLMRHEKASLLIEQVKVTSPDWFVELVRNRLRRIAKDIEMDRLEGSVALVELMMTLGNSLVVERSSQGDR